MTEQHAVYGVELNSPFDARPAERTCRACGHQWPHGAILVTESEPGVGEWVPNFCETCDDPCVENGPVIGEIEYEERVSRIHAAIVECGDVIGLWQRTNFDATDLDRLARAAVDAAPDRRCARCGHGEWFHTWIQDFDGDYREVNAPYQQCAACVHEDRDGCNHDFEPVGAPPVPPQDDALRSCDLCEEPFDEPEDGSLFRWYAEDGSTLNLCEDCLGKSFAWLWDKAGMMNGEELQSGLALPDLPIIDLGSGHEAMWVDPGNLLWRHADCTTPRSWHEVELVSGEHHRLVKGGRNAPPVFLKIEGSLLCVPSGAHGFIVDGKWVPA